jgi:hypothetical protein
MLPFMAGFAPRTPDVLGASIIATATAATTLFGTSITVNIPSSVLIGDTILIVGTMRGSNASGWSAGVPSGYSTLYSTVFSAFYRKAFAYYRTSATDGAHSTTFSYVGNPGSNGASCSVCVIVIRGNVSAPECGTLVDATSTTPNPPSITPSGGNKQYLVIPTTHVDWITSTTAVITEPSGYDPLVESKLTAGANHFAGCSCGVATISGTSFDPGTWTLDASKANGANTITVR